MKKRILLTKPNWPKNQTDSVKFWDTLNDCCSAHDVNIMPVQYGVNGTHAFHRYYSKNQKLYDLFIAHHPTSNGPKTIDYKQAYYSNLFYFDNNGYSGYSDLADTDFIDTKVSAKKVAKFCSDYVYPLCTETKYGYKNTHPLEAKVPDKFILVALQVEGDTVMKLKHRSSKYMIEAAVQTGRFMNLPVVVKFHPMARNNKELHALIQRTKSGGFPIYESQGDIRQLIVRAEAVFVINSGVGFEALLHHKPVFTFGACDYNYIAHAVPGTPREVASIIQDGPDVAQYERFFYSWWQQIVDVNQPGFKDKIQSRIDAKLES